MLQDVLAYGSTLVAAITEQGMSVIRQPGWEDATDWAELVADLPGLGFAEATIDYPHDYYTSDDGSEVVLIQLGSK